MIRIVIGSDHRGFEHKAVIQKGVSLDMQPIEWVDVGCFDSVRCDYPPFAQEVVKAMRQGVVQRGILLCGGGNGMAIAANRYKGIYAALAWDTIMAQRSKEEDNANILVLPADYITPEQAVEMVIVWLNAQFLGDRYQKRLAMIESWGGL